jgi:hypothetical protein
MYCLRTSGWVGFRCCPRHCRLGMDEDLAGFGPDFVLEISGGQGRVVATFQCHRVVLALGSSALAHALEVQKDVNKLTVRPACMSDATVLTAIYDRSAFCFSASKLPAPACLRSANYTLQLENDDPDSWAEVIQRLYRPFRPTHARGPDWNAASVEKVWFSTSCYLDKKFSHGSIEDMVWNCTSVLVKQQPCTLPITCRCFPSPTSTICR